MTLFLFKIQRIIREQWPHSFDGSSSSNSEEDFSYKKSQFFSWCERCTKIEHFSAVGSIKADIRYIKYMLLSESLIVKSSKGTKNILHSSFLINFIEFMYISRLSKGFGVENVVRCNRDRRHIKIYLFIYII
uniref:Uncharacterized protein n=1 Tax=Heterorhabditis bacteriophora TaxID=37862 RepID=A0A1I7WFB0_HETBA